jgi:hypothetical protein
MGKWRAIVISLASITCVLGLRVPASAASDWSVVPLSVSAYTSSLGRISCGGPSFCVAIGRTRGRGANALYHPLIEGWNGNTWSRMQSPAVPGANVYLQAVSCTSAKFCMLVGTTVTPSGIISSLTEQWNGTRWKIVPNAAEGEAATGISCIETSFCAVVGYTVIEEHSTSFGEIWDGMSWTATPTPNPGTAYTVLNGVNCLSSSTCVAVGVASFSGSPTQYGFSLALDWNGSTWTQFPSQNGPNPDSQNVLTGVTCRKTLGSCTAVGWYESPTPGSTQQGVIESWTPTGWTIVSSPQAPGGANTFDSVSCPRATRCIAVGTISNTGELIEEWNGTVWTISPGAVVPGTGLDVVGEISCTRKVCFAAGTYGSNPGQEPQHALLITSGVG